MHAQDADAQQAAAKGLEIALKQQQYSPGLVLDGLHTKTSLKPAAIMELWLTSIGLSRKASATGKPCWQGPAVAWMMDMTMDAHAAAARLGYVARAAHALLYAATLEQRFIVRFQMPSLK